MFYFPKKSGEKIRKERKKEDWKHGYRLLTLVLETYFVTEVF